LPRVYINTTFVAWNVSGFPILSHVEGRGLNHAEKGDVELTRN
jgi:hypothetical protein